MSKSNSLPNSLKSLVLAPLYPARASRVSPSRILPAGRLAGPGNPPTNEALTSLFTSVKSDAESRGLGWAEWLSVATATLLTLNSPSGLQALHRTAVPTSLALQQRTDRASLMREVGLKCIGFIGIPKVINNLAALRAAVEESDSELAAALPTEPRRHLVPDQLQDCHKSANDLWDDIYAPHSAKLVKILARSHPDLPVFIIEGEYGPLFAPPHTYTPKATAPVWDVDRLRTSLVAISALRAQGGVGPQVTSHIWGLLKAAKSIQAGEEGEKGRRWLTTEEGSEWVVRTVDKICELVETAAAEEAVREAESSNKSKL
ncbi:hypothetical protein OC846_004894 [Tilletia horrida]|uniref:Dol-P-Man:Man(5)GlcNAc(2)-PP-Dol alpha-1,3-mannosyltransferase n=1 Tax=Tilletia horrida TaxID=155126 RepID=A0AAN6GMG3_9BASI|nr:hypothetical protein OC845_005040 [Tilletia horrida]KAK0547353.1 hypothetical protein OC846_004894 [Tilletia horrida]KAK0562782.1 hypothetical protein OC861_005139 [Tilletia horrida]